MIDKELDLLDKYIEDNKLEIPSLEGKTFKEVMESVVNNKELFAQMLCVLSVFVFGNQIILPGALAKASIEHKINKKAFILNIVLDITFYLEFISYEKVTEESIIAKIINADFANELANIKIQLKEKNQDYNNMAREIDKELFRINKKYQDIQAELNKQG